MLADRGGSDDCADKRFTASTTYDITDTGAEPIFDHLLKLTSTCLTARIAFVCLLDEQRQYVVAAQGATITAIGAHLSTGIFPLPDNQFYESPGLETIDLYYAAMPLLSDDGITVGALSIFDDEPRTMTAVQQGMMTQLAAEALNLLKLQKNALKLKMRIADLSSKTRVAEELQVLSLVASKTNTGVNIMDKEGVTTWVNRSLEKLTGYTLDELKGNHLGDILSANFYDQQLLNKSRKMSRNKQSYAIEVTAEKKDGSQIWLEVSNTPVVNADGMVERQIDLISDITLRKQMEREMIEAREQALKLSQAKEMFLSVMSHEIRTPLNAVIGMTHLLLDNDPQPSQLEDLNILRFSGDNLLHIINDILDFNKIETGNVELEEKPFDLRLLASNIVSSLQANVKKNHNNLNLLFDTTVPTQLCGDKNRLYQILMNFLSNAIKFTDNGFVTLNINLLAEDEQGCLIKFVIEDTGIGIPKDKHDYIFETFKQANTDISKKYGGSGLGLAITKKLLNMHNARIEVDSVEGEGTSFSFEIEFKKVKESVDLKGSLPDLTVFAGKKILVVDDNEINIMIIRRILTKWGLVVDSATDGFEALERVDKENYDLLFMDIKMPGIDGFETTRLIRNKDLSRELPIIALTASTLKNDYDQFQESGMDGHVLKPFNPEEIKIMLSDIFSANQH